MKTNKRLSTNVPFLSPTVKEENKYVWVTEEGFQIVRYKDNDFITVLDNSNNPVSTFTLFKASNTGKKAYKIAKEDKEKEWAKALCSAALL